MNKIAIFEGYSIPGFGGVKRKRRAGRSKAAGAWRKKFGSCARKCAKGKKPGTKAVGSCMRSCLKGRG